MPDPRAEEVISGHRSFVLGVLASFLPRTWRVKRSRFPEARLNYLQSYVLRRIAEAPSSQMFNLAKLFRLRKGIDLGRLSASLVAAENPFNVEIMEHSDSTRLFIEYDTGRYSASTVRRYADLYREALEWLLRSS